MYTNSYNFRFVTKVTKSARQRIAMVTILAKKLELSCKTQQVIMYQLIEFSAAYLHKFASNINHFTNCLWTVNKCATHAPAHVMQAPFLTPTPSLSLSPPPFLSFSLPLLHLHTFPTTAVCINTLNKHKMNNQYSPKHYTMHYSILQYTTMHYSIIKTGIITKHNQQITKQSIPNTRQ